MYICIGIALATKGEFDSALADFNARLTTFEAGINSKIDSQVTSYLDRNGIWSGKKQELADPTFVFQETAPAVAVVSNAASGVKKWGNYTYVSNLTKSGLAVGTWRYRNVGGGNDNKTRWGWSGGIKDTGCWCEDNGFFLALNILVMDGTTENVLYSKCFGKSCGYTGFKDAPTTFYMFMPLTTSDIIVPFQFFVDKDQPLYWNVKATYHFWNVTSISPSTDNNSKIRIVVDDVSIY